MKLLRIVTVCALAAAMAGCTQRVVDFTAISTKNVEIAGKRGQRVVGRDVGHIILFIPTRIPEIKTATDRALETGGGDCLVDGVVEATFWYIPLIYGQNRITVTGTVINTREK
ncbi:MAG TPA: hypothetical protein PK280_16875 [Planctomycetota bacterium]|nr:hypothetical protein [Planctomycetota bacterium]